MPFICPSNLPTSRTLQLLALQPAADVPLSEHVVATQGFDGACFAAVLRPLCTSYTGPMRCAFCKTMSQTAGVVLMETLNCMGHLSLGWS